MGIRLVVAVTDRDWFNHLRLLSHLEEVNFWAPSASPFKALTPGELFLFKLHAPDNFIVGGGVFAYANILPCSLSWEAFGEGNGASSLSEMRAHIIRYRRNAVDSKSDFQIGCRILTQPFFLERESWIDLPPSWSPNIVTFKTYSTDDPDGKYLSGYSTLEFAYSRISRRAGPLRGACARTSASWTGRISYSCH
jgi:putative restriction endonuclease